MLSQMDCMLPHDAPLATEEQLGRAHDLLCVKELLATSPTQGYHALDVHGLERVALIDFDVRHGNGSEDIFRGDERVLMCSIFEKGLYPFNGEGAVGPNMVNVGLPSRSGSEAFRAAVTQHWLPALHAFKPQMLFISAGFDAHREDVMGNLGFVEADYAWVTKQLMEVASLHANGRVVSCLEGGYVMSPL